MLRPFLCFIVKREISCTQTPKKIVATFCLLEFQNLFIAILCVLSSMCNENTSRRLTGRPPHMKTSMRRMEFHVGAPNLGALALFAGAYVIAYRFGMSFTQEIAAPFWFPDSV